MARILVTDGIDKNAADDLRNMKHELVERYFEPEALKEQIRDFDVLIVRSATKVTKTIIDAASETKRLKLIIRAGVGIDNIDALYARENGITVANTPNASSAAVAELTIAHMFSLARYIYISNVTMREGQWNKKEYEGIELSGKTLGLVGFGRIAKETAKRALALGMKVIYACRSGKKDGYEQLKCVNMDELLKESDFISLHIPFDKEIGTVIGKKEFEVMKDGVYLINCARGGLVDEEALLEVLDTGKVAGAALDVFEQEPPKNEKLLKHSRVSLTPHIGASTMEAQAKIGKEIIEIIKNSVPGGV